MGTSLGMDAAVDWEYLKMAADASPSLRLESLEEVPKDLNICTKDGCDRTSPSPSSIGLFLLSLKSAGSIDLQGKISKCVPRRS